MELDAASPVRAEPAERCANEILSHAAAPMCRPHEQVVHMPVPPPSERGRSLPERPDEEPDGSSVNLRKEAESIPFSDVLLEEPPPLRNRRGAGPDVRLADLPVKGKELPPESQDLIDVRAPCGANGNGSPPARSPASDV